MSSTKRIRCTPLVEEEKALQNIHVPAHGPLLGLVFSFCTMVERYHLIVFVCKQWHHVVQDSPTAAENMDFSPFERVTSRRIWTHIQSKLSHIRVLGLPLWSREPGDKHAAFMALLMTRRLPRLKYLRIATRGTLPEVQHLPPISVLKSWSDQDQYILELFDPHQPDTTPVRSTQDWGNIYVLSASQQDKQAKLEKQDKHEKQESLIQVNHAQYVTTCGRCKKEDQLTSRCNKCHQDRCISCSGYQSCAKCHEFTCKECVDILVHDNPEHKKYFRCSGCQLNFCFKCRATCPTCKHAQSFNVCPSCWQPPKCRTCDTLGCYEACVWQCGECLWRHCKECMKHRMQQLSLPISSSSSSCSSSSAAASSVDNPGPPNLHHNDGNNAAERFAVQIQYAYPCSRCGVDNTTCIHCISPCIKCTQRFCGPTCRRHHMEECHVNGE